MADDGDLFLRLERAKVEAMQHLEESLRASPFWADLSPAAKGRKLEAFVRDVLRERPADEVALWTQAWFALVRYCDSNFATPTWRQLHASGKLDVRWPIYAAYSVWYRSGVDTAPARADLIGKCDLGQAATGALESLADEDWVRRIRRLFGERLGR